MPTAGTNPGSVAEASRPPRKRSASRFDLTSAQLAQAEWTDAVSQAFGRKATLERRGTRVLALDAAVAAHAVLSRRRSWTAIIDRMARVPGLRVEHWSRC